MAVAVGDSAMSLPDNSRLPIGYAALGKYPHAVGRIPLGTCTTFVSYSFFAYGLKIG
jgi:hypothetical protein